MRLRSSSSLLLAGAALLLAAGIAQACPGHSAMCCAGKSSACPTKTAAVVPAPLPAIAPIAVALPFTPLPSATSPAIVSGLMAFIDPETGMIGGSISDLTAPIDVTALNHAAVTPLNEVQLQDGSYMIDLQGSLQDYFVLNVDALGHRTVTCTPDPRHAEVAPIVTAPVSTTSTPIVER